jgi:hypothetical protein
MALPLPFQRCKKINDSTSINPKNSRTQFWTEQGMPLPLSCARIDIKLLTDRQNAQTKILRMSKIQL